MTQTNTNTDGLTALWQEIRHNIELLGMSLNESPAGPTAPGNKEVFALPTKLVLLCYTLIQLQQGQIYSALLTQPVGPLGYLMLNPERISSTPITHCKATRFQTPVSNPSGTCFHSTQ